MKSPEISIVIPVKNGIDTIQDCLNSIYKQTIYSKCEIVVIDSGSNDGTVELLKNQSVRLIEIDPKTFSHGGTRNLGVQHAKGDFVVMTVQDAVASTEDWLEIMYKHFEDPEVAGVCGQQIVPHHANKNPHEWFRPQSKPSLKRVYFENPADFLALSPKEQRGCCGWDDVNAMYRKSDLLDIPFEQIMFGEDMFWARTALLAGKKLIYNTASRVNHYHFQFPDYTYKRTLIAELFIYKCFKYLRADPFTFKDYLIVIYRNFKWKCELKWIWHNWQRIYFYRKALNEIRIRVDKNDLANLEKELALEIPKGVQKMR